MDLRGHRRRVAPLEVRDHFPGPAHLQPVEFRPRPLLRAARPGARRPAGVLVGPDVRVAGARARADRRRRPQDPLAAQARGNRGGILADVRRRGRGARGGGSPDDGAVASRSDCRLRPLVAARHVPRDPRLPLLHDHRPAHDPRDGTGPPDLRDLGRARRVSPDRAVDDRVRGQARRARRADHRLCGAAAPPPARRGTAARRVRGARARGIPGCPRRGGSAGGRRRGGRARRGGAPVAHARGGRRADRDGPRAAGDRRAVGGPCDDGRGDGPQDRGVARRGPLAQRRCVARTRPRKGPRGGDGHMARGPLAADRRRHEARRSRSRRTTRRTSV